MADTKINSAGDEQPVDKLQRYASMSTSALRSRQTIDLYDEPIPRSLSAKAKNYDIRMPDGSVAHLQEGTRITNKQIFAGAGTKTPIRDVDRLVSRYGGEADKWTKVKAYAILNHNGKTGKSEIHWYEEPTSGKQEMKLKIQPNGDWWV